MEKAIVSARAKGEYVQAIYQRYRRAARPEKKRILDEIERTTFNPGALQDHEDLMLF